MKSKIKNPLLVLLSATALLQGIQSVNGQAFSDNFDANSSASWTNFFGSPTNVTDFTLQFAFDYGTNKFVRNGVTNTIPSAPNSVGTTKGLKITVNKDTTNSPAALSVYPKNQSFSGDYSLKFDMWMNYNGGAYGGVDSTEHGLFGINHSGTAVIAPTNAVPSPTVGDGVWFTVAGEAGTDPDYRAYVGTGASSTDVGAVVFPDRDEDTVRENTVGEAQPATHPLKLIFPSPQFESAGAPGKQWAQVEIRQVAGIVSWLINGYVIAEHGNGTAVGQVAGNIMIGYADLFSGVPSPKEDVYIIYDNVRVFTNIATPTVVTASKTVDASEPSNAGTFRISRTGSTAQALTVSYQVLGSAKSNIDYTPLSGTAIIPVGQTFVDVNVNPINDTGAEATETIVMSLIATNNYDVGAAMMATMSLSDDGDTTPVVNARALKSTYELLPNRPGKLELYVFQPVGSTLNINYTLTGTALNGVNYTTIPTSASIDAGLTNVIIDITPINDQVINSNRTAILTVSSSGGYQIGDASATVVIRNDDFESSGILFADNFETTSSATNWSIFKTKAADPVNFGYDYSNVGNDLPVAPHTTNGTKNGLMIEVNVFTAGAFSGVSLSPTNKSFTGDYRLRFDAWANYNGPPLFDGGSQSTEFLSAGVGTTGTHLQSETNDAGGSAAILDGIWFAMDGDGGNVSRDIRAFRAEYRFDTAVDPGVYAAGSQRALNPYYNFMGVVEAPAGQKSTYPTQQDTGASQIGNSGFEWHDWVITKRGAIVTWEIDGVLFATASTNNSKFSTNVFVGSFDPTSGICPAPAVQYVMIDNLRVESLSAPQTPVITAVKSINNNTQVQIDFTGSAADAPGAFSLRNAATVSGTYTAIGATIISTGTGTFRATANIAGSTGFYRIAR